MGRRHPDLLSVLAREAAGILRALQTEAQKADRVPAEADFVLLLVEEETDPSLVPLPDLKDRAGSALALATEASEGRVALSKARRHLRAHGASLGSREMVFSPDQFGPMGMESDAQRERLEILLRTLAHDAERLRLRREGWEEPLE